MPYPYTVTIAGLNAAIRQLRSAFPVYVGSDTLKKWGIAPNNETYVIHVLRFLGIIDENGKKQAEASSVFVEHDDSEFAQKFAGLVRSAYSEVFEHFGAEAWTLSKEKLIGFFRAEDHTSATVGTRQANTFLSLAQTAGFGPPPAEPKATPGRRRKASAQSPAAQVGDGDGRTHVPTDRTSGPPNRTSGNGVPAGTSLTVRIEINLPVTDKQDIYDKIFKSIRANLIDA